MNHSIVGTMVVLAGLAVTTTAPVSMRVSPAAQTVRLTNDVLRDKIRGGWAGQTVGVTFGGPTEFRYRGTMIDDYTPIAWNPPSTMRTSAVTPRPAALRRNRAASATSLPSTVRRSGARSR